MANIWVGGLPQQIDEATLRQLFESFGQILEVKVCPPKNGNQSFGFVNFSSPEIAQGAIAAMNGYEYEGTPLIVRVANSAMGKGGGGGQWGAWDPSGGQASSSTNVYVAGLPEGSDEETLKQMFEQFGEISKTRVLPPKTGTLPFGFVDFASVEAAQMAIKTMHGQAVPGGGELQVRLANAKRQFGAGPEWGGGAWDGGAWGGGAQWGGAGWGGDCGAWGGPPRAPLSNNLYVCGFNDQVDDNVIRQMFEQHGGVISTKICQPKQPGGSLYAFVRMDSEESVQRAIAGMHGIDHGFGQLTVRLADNAQAKPEMAGGMAGGFGGKGAEEPQMDNLFVKGLPVGITSEQLQAVFSQYGTVAQCKVMDCPPDSTSAAALVRMGSAAEAKMIIETLNGNIPMGLSEPIMVAYKRTSKGGKGGAWGAPAWGGGGGGWDNSWGGGGGASYGAWGSCGGAAKGGWGQQTNRFSPYGAGGAGAKGYGKGQGALPYQGGWDAGKGQAAGGMIKLPETAWGGGPGAMGGKPQMQEQWGMNPGQGVQGMGGGW
mmetsp:Transcript_60804/g.131928  ORF Transcript_60804/g.131928 Transcript_60804/m.131928 type:complete len:542 (-) Transcript_60804:97-1722(-)